MLRSDLLGLARAFNAFFGTRLSGEDGAIQRNSFDLRRQGRNTFASIQTSSSIPSLSSVVAVSCISSYTLIVVQAYSRYHSIDQQLRSAAPTLRSTIIRYCFYTAHVHLGSPQSDILSKTTKPIKMVKLHMSIWAGIAAGAVMVLLVFLPILGCMFSRSKKAKKAAEVEELAAEKGEVVCSTRTPAVAPAPAPTRPVNAVFQKPAAQVKQHEFGVRAQSSTQSMSPSYQSQASTIAPQSPLRNSTPSPPHMQPMWVRPSP